MKRERKNKYHNTITVIDGISFASRREAERYLDLKTLERFGVITELELQKKFELQPSFMYKGRRQRPINYICDFYYKQDGKYIIEDVKSPVTINNSTYKLKKKMMLYRGYEIKEVL